MFLIVKANNGFEACDPYTPTLTADFTPDPIPAPGGKMTLTVHGKITDLNDPDIKLFTSNTMVQVEFISQLIGTHSSNIHELPDCSGYDSCDHDINIHVPEDVQNYHILRYTLLSSGIPVSCVQFTRHSLASS
ncbi:21020_t:CDS:1, partial [Dentiscutata erythropus]